MRTSWNSGSHKKKYPITTFRIQAKWSFFSEFLLVSTDVNVGVLIGSRISILLHRVYHRTSKLVIQETNEAYLLLRSMTLTRIA